MNSPHGTQHMVPHADLDLAEEVGLEAAGCVVPAESLAVPVPELQAVLRLPVLISEV